MRSTSKLVGSCFKGGNVFYIIDLCFDKGIKIQCLKCKKVYLAKKQNIVFVGEKFYSDCNICMSTNFFTLKDIFGINSKGYVKGK